MIEKNKIVRISLVVLLFLTGIFDLVSTFIHPSFVQLESNPIYLLTKNYGIMIGLKIFLLCWIGYCLMTAGTKSRFIQYLFVYLVVCVSAAQFWAGCHNYSIKQNITEDLGYEVISDVPKEEVQSYVKTEKQALSKYLWYIWLIIYLPAILALSSFKLWEWSY
jgi:hypothetical protein